MGLILTIFLYSLISAVHPHTCGANADRGFIAGRCAVHPHTCGANDYFLFAPGLTLRFIPTHVGLMLDAPAEKPATTVHPHTCGANVAFFIDIATFIGSSPHMWG